MRVALLSLALAGCLASDLVPCGALLCGVDQVCTPTGCIDRSRVDACNGLTDEDACTVKEVPGTCREGACTTQICGDGVIEGLEECEGEQYGGATCLAFGFYDASGLRCSSDCRFDTSECVGTCGDNIVNGPELCDTTPGDVLRCSDIGFDYGSVTCSAALCAPLYDRCANFGWRPRLHQVDTPTWISAPRPGTAYLGGHNAYFRLDGGTSLNVSIPHNDCGVTRKGWVSPTDDVFVATELGVCREVLSGWVLDPIGSFHAIWGTASNDLYAVGSGIYHYDGATWTGVATGLPAGEFHDLNGRGATIVATRADGMVAISQSGVWTLEAIGVPPLAKPWISPAGDIYVLGEQELHRRTPSGWQSVRTPSVRMNYVWGLGERAIYASDGARLWAYDLDSWMRVELPEAFVGWAALGGSDTHLVYTQPYQRFYESSGFVWSTIDDAVDVLDASPHVWAIDGDRVMIAAGDDAVFFDMDVKRTYSLGQNVSGIWGIGTTLFAIGSASLLVFDGTSWSTRPWNGCNAPNRVWGETANRVFFAGSNNLCMWNGTTVTRVPLSAVTDVWGSAATGTFVTTSTGSLRFIAPGADLDTAITLTAPGLSAKAIWGDDDEIVVAFDDTTIFRRAHGATTWTQVPHELVHPITSLRGQTSDVFGLADDGFEKRLVHWDGVTWDEVAVPSHMPSMPHSLFSSSVGTWLTGNRALVQMFRPR
ncbi:MAG: hypothetical protein ACKV2T_38860 [Kofleriaceae bacterium]